MNELLPEPKTVIGGLLAILMGLLAWLGKRMDRRVAELEKYSVPREELDKKLAQMQQERQRMHDENTRRLEEISDTTTRTHERIDQIYRDMMQR